MLKSADETIFREKFKLLDEQLSTVGLTTKQKNTIYMVLSAILNLGNIDFETVANNDGCSIKIDSRHFLCNAAALLNIKEVDLECALTSHTREIKNQQIKYTFYYYFHQHRFLQYRILVIVDLR